MFQSLMSELINIRNQTLQQSEKNGNTCWFPKAFTRSFMRHCCCTDIKKQSVLLVKGAQLSRY